jgi:hypothetical protein
MILNEIFSKTDILQNILFHDTLNKKIWDEDNQLKKNVKEHLLDIVDRYYEFLEIPDLEIEDIILTGSNAGYNYTDLSDLDLHLIVDLSSISEDDLARKYFDAKKSLWSKTHNITIKGYNVELYVEDKATPVKAAGIYSIKQGIWVKEPKPERPSTDDISIVSKTNQYVSRIDEILSEPNRHDVEIVLDDIYRMRQCGLQEGGEWSTENLVFKSLRSLDYIEKLKKELLKIDDAELTLENIDG